MSNLTIRTGLDASGFKTGLQQMLAEGEKFKATFAKAIGRGQGISGAADSAVQSLSSGRFAAPLAAVTAGLNVVLGYVQERWEAIAKQSERTARNAEQTAAAMRTTGDFKFQGEARVRELERRNREANTTEQDFQTRPVVLEDPSTMKGRARNVVALNGGVNFTAAKDFVQTSLSAIFSGMPMVTQLTGLGGSYNAQKDAYNKQEEERQAAKGARMQSDAETPQLILEARLAQQDAESLRRAAQDRQAVAMGGLRMPDGEPGKAGAAGEAGEPGQPGKPGEPGKAGAVEIRVPGMLALEAAANRVEDAVKRQRVISETIKDPRDPRRIAAETATAEAQTNFQNEVLRSQSRRNDPVIVGDQLARVGGGGNVGVFGDGTGQIITEARRTTEAVGRVEAAIKTLATVLQAKGGNGDITQ